MSESPGVTPPGAAARRETVGSLMRRQFITIAPDACLLDAEQVMRLARVRHLAVVRAGVLVGLLSYRDVLEASIVRLLHERLGHLRLTRVDGLMHRRPHTIGPDAPLAEAAHRLARLRIGCLPVVEDSRSGPRVIGLLTESDLLMAAYDSWPELPRA